MDEFTTMGKVDILAASIAHTTGYGLRFLPMIQSLSQLDATYGQDVARTYYQPRRQHRVHAARAA